MAPELTRAKIRAYPDCALRFLQVTGLGGVPGGVLATVAAIATSMALLLIAPPVFAASGPTRSEYVEQVEPICKSATLAHRTVLKGVDGMVKRGKLKKAAPRFQRAAAALRATTRSLAAVPRPTADAARLGRWLNIAKAGGGLLTRISATLQRDDRTASERLAKQLLKKAKRANAEVVGFNFNYCRMNPARFV